MLTTSTYSKSFESLNARRLLKTISLLFLFISGFSGFSVAQSTYTSAGGGNWSSISWSPAGTPGPSDNVVINHNITVDVPVEINNLLLNASRTLSLGSSDLVVHGTSTISGTMRDNDDAGSTTFEGAVTINASGRLDVASGISGNVEFRSGIATTGVISMINNSLVRFTTFPQSIFGTGTTTINAVSIEGNIALTNLLASGSGLLILTSLEGNSVNSSFINGAGGILTYRGTDAPMSAAGLFNATATDNTVNYNGSVQDVKSTAYYNLTFSAAGAKTIDNITVNGNFTRTNGTLTFTGTQTFSGNDNATLSTNTSLAFSEIIVNKAGATLTLSGNNLTTGMMTVTAGTFAFGTSARTITLSDDLSGAGTIDMTGAAHILNLGGANNTIGDLVTNNASSRINYNRTGDQEVFGSNFYQTLYLSGTGTKTLSGGVKVLANLNMNSSGSYFLSLGNNNFKFGPAATLTGSFSANRYIITDGEGYLIKESTTSGDFRSDMTGSGLYPVGSGGFYTPFQISALTCSVTGTGSIMVRAVPTRQPNIPYFNNALTKYWELETANISSITSTVRFTFNTAEVIGSVALYSPSVWDGSSVVTPNNPSAPGSNPIISTGTNFLAGSWTAVDPTVRSALYSYQSGNWNNANTWTTDPSGNTLVSPMIPQPGDQVIILNGRTITNTSSNDTIGSLTINQGGILDLAATSGHSFGPISGKGKLRLSTINIPDGNYNNFTSSDGGTIEYYNTGSGTVVMSSSLSTYNHLEISNSTSTGITVAVNHNITLNGNLEISKSGTGGSTFQIASASGNRTLNLNGNVTVGAGCFWNLGNNNSTHTINIQGSLVNNGNIDFQNGADYTNSSNGEANVNFQGANSNTNVTLNAGSSTTFYGFTSNKNTGYQLSVTAASGSTVNFVGSSKTFSQLGNGTLRLGANITIPRLFGQGSGNWDHGSTGVLPLLWIDGADITDGGVSGAVVPYGTIKVSSGSFTCSNGQKAIVIRESGGLEINGGTVSVGILRTSVTAVTHRGSFIMNGGTLNVRGDGGAEQSYYACFSLPYPENVFKMYGGVINITRANTNNSITPNGGFMVVSSIGNYEVTGGTVNFNSTANIHCDVTSTVPLYNVNIGRATAGSGQVRLNTIDWSYNGSNANRESAVSQPLVVLNDLNILSSSSPVLNAMDNDVVVGGNFTINSGSTLYSGNNAIRFNSALPQNFTINGSTSFLSAGGDNLINGPENIVAGANYTFERLTSTPNIEMSPVNTLTAEALYETNQNGIHRFYTPFIPSSGPVTASMYVKPNGRTCVSLQAGNYNSRAIVWYNLSGAGSVSSTNGQVQNATISAEANGWYRITVTSAGDSQYRLRFVMGNGSCAETYSGNSSLGVFAWGLKVEQSSTASPYSSSSNTGINSLVVEKIGSSTLSIAGSVSTLQLNGSLQVLTGELNHSSKVLNVKGGVTNNTIANGTGSGKINLNGSSAQIIYGDGDGSFYKLQLTNTGGSAGDAQVIATASFSIINNLQLESARVLDIENNTLNLSAATTITSGSGGFSANRFIRSRGFLSDGGIAKEYSASYTSFVFPLGSGTNYTPATISFTSAPASWGTLNVRPVAAQQLYVTDPDAYEYYWKVNQSGFTGIAANSMNLVFNYGNLPDNTAYIPGYYNFSEIAYTTVNDVNAVDETTNEIRFNSFSKLEGDFTAGVPAAFGTVVPYYSRTTGDWNNPTTWSNTGHGGNVAASIPNDHVPVFVGDDGYNHTVTVTTNNTYSGSLLIAAGSTLDLGTTTGNNFGALPYSTAGGAGKIKISSSNPVAEFPAGDFGLFFLEDGGTAEYYTTGTNFTIPLLTASPTQMDIPSYRTLIFSPAAANKISLPARDLLVYQNMTVSGVTSTAEVNLSTSSSQEVTVMGNLLISGGRLRINSTEEQILSIHGNMSVSNGATLDVSGSGGLEHTINLYGNLTNNGTMSLNSTNGIILNMTGTASAVIDGNNASASTGFYILRINKGEDASLVTELTNAGTITSPNTEWLELINGTFRITKSGTLTLSNSNNTPFHVPGNTRLSVNHTGAVVNIAQHNSNGSDLVLGGILEINHGTVNIGAFANTAHNDLEYTASGAPTVDVRNSASLNVNGQIRRSVYSLQGSLSYIQSGNSTVLVRGKNPEGASSFNLDRAKFEILNDNSSFSMSDNALLIIDRSGNASNMFGDIYLDPASFNITGGTVVLGTGNTASNMTFFLLSNSPFYNLTIDGTTTNKIIRNTSLPLTVINDFFLEGDSQFRANGLDVTIGGDFTNTHTSNGIGISTGGYRPESTSQTTTFNGSTGNQSITGLMNNLTNFSNLVVNNTYPTGVVTLNPSTNIRVNGNTTLLSGNIDLGDNQMTVLGDVTTNVDVVSAAGSFVLNGTASQDITGDGTASFDKLRMNNPVGAELFAPITINEDLLFSQGILYINNHLLTFGESATISGSTNSNQMIRLNGVVSDAGVKKLFGPSSGSFTFPFGTTLKYTPAAYSVSSNSAAGTITAKPVNVPHPATTDVLDLELQYYWSVNSTGFSGSALFDHEYSYFPGDALNGNESNYVTGRFFNNVWIPVGGIGSSVNASSDKITLSAVDYIKGDYTAGETTEFGIIQTYFSRNATSGGNWNDVNSWSTDVVLQHDGAPAVIAPDGKNIVIAAGHTITVSDNTKNAPTSVINGTLALGNTFGHNFGVVSGTGTVQVTPTGSSTFLFPGGDFAAFNTTGGGTFEYNSTTTATLPSQAIYNNLLFTGSGQKRLPAQDLIVNGNCTIQAGSVSNISNRTMTLYGNWSNFSGLAGFTPGGTGTVVLAGTLQQISGSTGFANLKIQGGNIKNLNSSIYASHLYLTSGIVATNSNEMIIQPGGSVIGGSSASYVNGNLKKSIPAAAVTVNFEIGDDNTYAPVNVVFSGSVAAGGTLLARTDAGDNPSLYLSGLDANKSCNRSWSLTPTSLNGFSSFTAEFHYVFADLDPSANTSNFIGSKYASGIWSVNNNASNYPSYTALSGNTSFGLFQIGEALNGIIWTGNTNTNWNLASNWQPNSVPGSDDDIIVGLVTNQPNISTGSNGLCRNMNLNSGVVITIAPTHTLNVAGNINSNNSTITGSGDLIITGASSLFDGSATIGSNCEIASGAVLSMENNSTIEFQRDLNVGGQFNINAQSVVFGGAQSSDVSGSALSFADLTINKTSSDIEVSLGTDFQVSGNLTLSMGDLNLNSHNIDLGSNGMLVSETADNRVYGSSGTIQAQRTLNNISSFDVAGLGMQLTSSANMGLTDVIRGHQQRVFNAGFGIDRYYEVHPANNNSLDATMEFNYFEDELATGMGTIVENELDLWRFDGAYWNVQWATLDVANNKLVKSGIPEFSTWTAGSRDNNALPITLINFDGVCNGSMIKLSWSTASESNNKEFFVEESEDAVNWVSVRTVPGAGNSTTNKNYSESVSSRFSGGSYFRLTQVDFNGNTESFDPVFVNCESSLHNEVNISPNPAHDYVNVKITSSQDLEAALTMFSTSGKILFTRQIILMEGINNIRLDISDIPAGAYHLNITNDKRIEISGGRSIIKQ